MGSIELTEFKDILSGKYRKDNKEYPLILGIRENQNGNRFITALYIDNANNQIKILFNDEIDNLKGDILLSISKNEKIYAKIKELKTTIPNFKEFFKIIESLKMNELFKIYPFDNIELYISERDLAYWIYEKIYYGNIDKDTYLELVSVGENTILGFHESAIERIAKRFIEKGLSNSQKNVTIET